MDVSDFRYLQIIYTILADHEFERISFSNFQFRQLIINGFRNLNISIHITASPFVFMIAMRLFFPDSREAYQTPLGTFFLILSIATACVGYIVGNKVLNSAGKVLEIGGE